MQIWMVATGSFPAFRGIEPPLHAETSHESAAAVAAAMDVEDSADPPARSVRPPGDCGRDLPPEDVEDEDVVFWRGESCGGC